MLLRIIYLDEVFAVNLLTDFFLLDAVAALSGRHARATKKLAGAFVGAVYAVLTVLPAPAIQPLSSVPMRLLVSALMLLISFGLRIPLLRLAACFGAVSAVFAGSVLAASLLMGKQQPAEGLSVNLRLLAASLGCSYLLLTLLLRSLKKSAGADRQIPLSVWYEGCHVHLLAMCDTGNRLRDPLTSRQVVVADRQAMLPLFSDTTVRILSGIVGEDRQLEALSSTKEGRRFSLVPYRALGTESGLLLCFRPDRLIAEGREYHDRLIGISPHRLFENSQYTAIMHEGGE